MSFRSVGDLARDEVARVDEARLDPLLAARKRLAARIARRAALDAATEFEGDTAADVSARAEAADIAAEGDLGLDVGEVRALLRHGGGMAVYHERMLRAHMEAAVDHAEAGGLRDWLGQALSWAFDTVAAGSPHAEALGERVRDDARWWADMAAPIEVEAYVAAGLRRIERASFAPAARKRLLVALWETLPRDDRRRFLARVDPEGRFAGEGA